MVHEIERLEYLYHASNQAYTDSLATLGFAMTETLKSYSPEVRIGYATDKIGYQVRIVPLAASMTDAWLLTSYRDGSVQMDRIPVSDLVMFASVRYVGNAAAMTPVEATNPLLAVGCRAPSNLSGLVAGAPRGAKSAPVSFSIASRAPPAGSNSQPLATVFACLASEAAFLRQFNCVEWVVDRQKWLCRTENAAHFARCVRAWRKGRFGRQARLSLGSGLTGP